MDDLLEKQRMLEKILKNSGIGTWQYNLKTNKSISSDVVFTMAGYEPGEFENNLENWFERIHPENRKQVEKSFNKFIKNGNGVYEEEYRWRKKDGSYMWILGRAEVFDKENEKVTIIGGVHIDISRRKEMEEKLKESENKYKKLVDMALEGIWVLDKDVNTTFANNSMARMLGYTGEEMMGKHLFSFMDEKNIKIAKGYLKRRHDGISEHHEFEFISKTGERVFTTMETAPILDDEGNYTGAIAGLIDITERKKAEEKLKEALDEKDVLLKEVHHRVKNNMQLISSMLNLQQRASKSEEVKNLALDTKSRLEAMASAHEMLYRATKISEISLASSIKLYAMQMYQATGKSNIKIHYDLEECKASANCILTMGLLLNEILSNAFKHAFPNNSNGNIYISLKKKDDGKCILNISDDGKGIDSDEKTKEIETLGAMLIENFVTHLGGSLEIKKNGGLSYIIEFMPIRNQKGDLQYNSKVLLSPMAFPCEYR